MSKATKKKTKRRRMSRGGGKAYFTKDHENAIVQYASSDSREEKTKLYVELINPAFNEMVDKIVYTYKFTNLPNVDSLKDECEIHLITILSNFDRNKGSNAFSYFSVITKNWFIHEVKKNQLKRKRESLMDDVPTSIEEKYLTTHNPFLKDLEKKQFWEALNAEISHWERMPMKHNEEKVYKAVKILLSSPDDIEIFNKKAIYLYLRELTGLNTKQVVNNLNKLRSKYKSFKIDWDAGNVKHIKKEDNKKP